MDFSRGFLVILFKAPITAISVGKKQPFFQTHPELTFFLLISVTSQPKPYTMMLLYLHILSLLISSHSYPLPPLNYSALAYTRSFWDQP